MLIFCRLPLALWIWDLMPHKVPLPFDFSAYKLAFEAKDALRWIEFFADDAEWIEYRNQDPPSRPRHIHGKAEIQRYVESLARGSPSRTIESEVISTDRVAFRTWTALLGGQWIVEHVILEIVDGKISKQVDVEAWDLAPQRDGA